SCVRAVVDSGLCMWGSHWRKQRRQGPPPAATEPSAPQRAILHGSMCQDSERGNGAPISWCAAAEGSTVNEFTIHDGLSLDGFVFRLPIGLSSEGRWLADSGRTHSRQETTINGYTRNGVPEEVVQGVVWVTEVETGNARCLTPDWGSSWAARWSPDGKRLAF